jgi:hypothetical protein
MSRKIYEYRYKSKRPFNLNQIKLNCNNGWADWIERNKDKGLTFFVFRYIDSPDYCVQECGIMHKVPEKKQWTRHAYMNITKMLNNNPIENKEQYIKKITKVVRKELT